MTAILATLVLLTAAVEPTEDTIAAAELAGLDPMLVQGAVNSTGLGPFEYLLAVGELAAPRPAPPYGLSPYLARVAACESDGFRPDVVYGPTRGRAGEIGLFQLHPRGLLPLFYARGYTDPWSPDQQARFAEWAFNVAGLARHWSCR